eukprot:TRINITY_DN8537_c0_g1_i3.p1 TRINITY_DN8537_c0_g1~~TRINITY_DN8537_c0_g1_i3.p1  ORF type:complete len:112 (+),score=5.00 TRINITY_DN8537_c0_g1_i3:53-388(+)
MCIWTPNHVCELKVGLQDQAQVIRSLFQARATQLRVQAVANAMQVFLTPADSDVRTNKNDPSPKSEAVSPRAEHEKQFGVIATMRIQVEGPGTLPQHCDRFIGKLVLPRPK